MASEKPIPRFFLVLVAGTALLLAMVIRPVASELFLACVLAGVLWPLQQWLTRRFRGRRNVAAGLLTLGVVVLLLGPLATLGAFVIRDGADGVKFVVDALHSEDVERLIEKLPDPAREAIEDGIARLPTTVGEAVDQVSPDGQRAAAAVAATALARTGSVVVHAAFMLIALFFLLVRGDALVNWLDSISPLPRGETLELLHAFKKVSYAVIVSTVITGAVQAVVALVGYLIARVPNPVFFAVVTFFVAFIPAIGAASVCLLAAALLLVTGHPYMALFLALWGILIVGLVDNVVKPLLLKGGMELHGAVVFFSLIGGLAAFGAIGLLVGPLVVSLFLALVRLYHRDFSPGDARTPSVPGLRDGETAPQNS
jgi:predicted PurR-regulated permease PerM